MRLLLIPPDVRPVTLCHPIQLARMAGIDVRIPPPKALPELNVPGDCDLLSEWLRAEATGADALIVCLETLTLGGMIPARRVNDRLEDVLARLAVLADIKRDFPKLRILAFGVIVRVAHDNDPLEEKEYYGQWGTALRAYSHAVGQGELEPKCEAPAEILTDWLSTRQRNHALHLEALELLSSGVLEHLCLTLDDTTLIGLAALDRRQLEARADELGVWPKLDIYPGADEVPVTLLARLLRHREPQVYVLYSGTLGSSAELIYEDRPVGELVRAHLRAAGCRQAESLVEADFVLAINVPGIRQANGQPDFNVVDTPHRHLPAFVDEVRRLLRIEKRVVLADIAYPNGAERRLWCVMRHLPLAKLTGYAAWNTAGNTLGSALAQGVIPVQDDRAHTEMLFARFIDDALYQGFVRSEVRAELGEVSPFDLGPDLERANELVAQRMTPEIEELWARHFSNSGFELCLGKPSLSWPRLFTGVFPLEIKETSP